MLYQHALHHVIETMLLYKRGPPIAELRQHARSAYTAFVLLARTLGLPELWPKLHELLHLPRDVQWFGAANSTDAGKRARMCVCVGVYVCVCMTLCA